MTLKTLTTALALTLLPGLALAGGMGCGGTHGATQEAMSCAEGMVFDTETGTCVPIVTG